MPAIADVFGRYGNFTLGGGSATVAVLHRELLEKRRWIGVDAFTLCFGLARLTPGTNVLAFCTAVGWLLRGWAGAAVALLAASVPCTLVIVVLTAAFAQAERNLWVQAAIHGAVAAAVAITARTSWTIAHPHFKPGARLRVVSIGAAAFLLYTVAGVPAIEVLLLAAVTGAVLPVARS
ncbi:chromate transporter [Sphingomonas sp. PWP1-2]|uniref:chromate transporter n=1 Tax=Sphingomonas sp. PWP1-2 TaxID=2804558 RepID=UPI003CFA4D54